MADCKKCKHKNELTHICDECTQGEMYEKETKTNADRIRNMSDTELAEFIEKVSRTCIVDALGGSSECNTECRICKIKFGSILEWLQSEA